MGDPFFDFEDWKRRLFKDSGSANAPVRNLGDFVLELFWKDGCEPTVAGLLNYAQSGLQPAYEAKPHPKPERPSATVAPLR